MFRNQIKHDFRVYDRHVATGGGGGRRSPYTSLSGSDLQHTCKCLGTWNKQDATMRVVNAFFLTI